MTIEKHDITDLIKKAEIHEHDRADGLTLKLQFEEEAEVEQNMVMITDVEMDGVTTEDIKGLKEKVKAADDEEWGVKKVYEEHGRWELD